jgi:hypothetical protein
MGCFLRFFPISVYWHLSIVVWVMFHFSNTVGLNSTFLNSYLDDFLAIPIVLGGILVLFRKYFFKTSNYTFSTFQVWSVVLIFSIYFEVIAPKLKPEFTADWVDVMCYLLGGFVFQLVLNKPLMNRQEQVSCAN